jgi:hypothetical protein
MKNYNIIPIKFQMGIQRDGTPYDAKSCINGQWVRFYENAARKMGGYKITDIGNSEIVRTMFVSPRTSSIDVYLGRQSSLSKINITISGETTAEIDRTPLTGFSPNPNNLWCFDLFTNSESGIVTSQIVAQVSQSGQDISSVHEGPIFHGSISNNLPLEQLFYDDNTPVLASGGIIYVSPIMVAYGNDGALHWSDPTTGDITKWDKANFSIVANTKLVKAYRTRGNATPSILVWSLNSLVRASFQTVGSSTQLTFVGTTIEDDISILSTNCIIKYNQMFFWIGVDQFYFFNGIVQKLKNTMNNDWFFQNVNLSQRQKIWGVSIPRFKELWWFYPRGNSIECNAAIIYNLESESWYDTEISRSSGVGTSLYPYPLFTSSVTTQTQTNQGVITTYPLWTHEIGTNRVENNNVFPINSYFETNQTDLWSSNIEVSCLIRNRRIAPDFVQPSNTSMTVTVNTQKYPSSPIVSDGPHTFSNITEKIDLSSQGGIVSFLFQSNQVDGFYQSGKTLFFFEKGDTFK